MELITKENLDLADFVDYAKGLGVTSEDLEIHKDVLLRMCQYFRSNYDLVGIGITYLTQNGSNIPFFEVWHNDICEVPNALSRVMGMTRISQQTARVSRNIKIDNYDPPTKKGVVKIITGRNGDFEQEYANGLFFIPSSYLREVADEARPPRFQEIQTTRHF